MATIAAVIVVAALALWGNEVWFDRPSAPGHASVRGKEGGTPLAPSGAVEPATSPPFRGDPSRGDVSRGDTSAPTRTVYHTTAARLYQDYLANAVATQSKIADSRVRITGTISAIDENAAGQPVVRLAASNVDSVNATLGEDEIAAAAQLSRGQTVDIQCDRMRRITGSPEGSQCHLELVQENSPAPPVATTVAVAPLVAPTVVPVPPAPAAAPRREAARVTASRSAHGTKRSPAPLPAIAMVPAVPSLLDSGGAPTPLPAAETTSISAIAAKTPTASRTADSSDSGPAGASTPAVITPAVLTPAAIAPAAIAPAAAAAAGTSGQVPAPAPPGDATAAGDATASAPDATAPATPSPAAAPDDLAAVRAADPQAADHIASYCASSSAAGASGAANCRRDERDAWTRLVQNKEFPTLNDATRQKCSQPPFPDSYRAKEVCAKYELRIE